MGEGEGEAEPEHDPPLESMREVKRTYEEAADRLEAGLQEWPAAMDEETVGHADTAKAMNDAMSALFKLAADRAAGVRAIADKVDLEAGTFDGIPVERKPSDGQEFGNGAAN